MGADFGGLAAVETHAFVENAAANGFFLNVVIVAFYEGGLFIALFFGERFYVFVADGVEAVLAPVLVGTAGFCDGVCAVVAFFAYVGAEGFVVYFMAVFALCLAYSLGEFHLDLALGLDGFVGGTEGGEEFGELYFDDRSGKSLPLGTFCRFAR